MLIFARVPLQIVCIVGAQYGYGAGTEKIYNTASLVYVLPLK